MSKVELAAAARLSANSLSSYENSKTTPTEETVGRLAEATRFPQPFFYRAEAPLVRPEVVSFRSLARVPAAQRDRVRASTTLAIELDAWIDERFHRPRPSLPDLSGMGPVEAAEAIRSEWGLGPGTIHNLVNVAEAMGIRVYSLDTEHLGAIDGLSMWSVWTPFVFLATGSTTERIRHSLAHEIAHLVLHRDGGPTGQAAEREANSFAGNLLLPRSGLLAEARRYQSFHEIIEAKQRWRVSALAYVYRMNQEKLLDDWRYKELCIRLRREYGTQEPEPTDQPERSQVLRKVFSQLQADGGHSRVAAELNVSLADLDSLIFGFALVSLDGDRTSECPPRPADLRLLK